MRALVVSNMLPDASHPERGRFVRDQVEALRSLHGVEVELHELAPGPRELVVAGPRLRRRYRAAGFDVVHAHFGLTAWPALAVPAPVRALTLHGTDLAHPRTRRATLAALRFYELLAVPSSSLLELLPPAQVSRAQLLPVGVDTARFRPFPRAQARAQLGLDQDRPYLLFPADPSRPEKRYGAARALAADADTELLALGGVDPDAVPLWVNAANAVIVPSEREGFGLAVLEALACNVPVLATPVGIHEQALSGIAGTICAPFDLDRWREALQPHLEDPDPHIEGREAAARFSTATCAQAVLTAWEQALAHPAAGSGRRGG